MPKNYKQTYKRKVRVNKTKKLVTGDGPTMLERLASQSNNIGQVAKAILPIAMAINTEAKYFDVSAAGAAYTPGTNDLIVNLTQGIAQGITDVTRIGNSVLAKNIAIKINTQYTATTASPGAFGRIILLVWKENLQLNAPTAAKLFEAPTAVLSAFNKDYTDQMVILKDKVFPLEAPFSANAITVPRHVKIFKKLDFHQRWIDGTATGGSVNHIYLIFRCNAATVANQLLTEYYSRLNFTDN